MVILTDSRIPWLDRCCVISQRASRETFAEIQARRLAGDARLLCPQGGRSGAARRPAELSITTRLTVAPSKKYSRPLLEPTPNDPAGFVPPPAREWYRWALCQPAVSVALMAPDNGDELAQNLALLND